MSYSSGFNQYRVMWIMVLFDLPTNTKIDRKTASKFRKNLLDDGFNLFQYSIYTRHCSSRENAQVHKRRIRKILPPEGKVSIITITDKQFGMMEMFFGKKEVERQAPVTQLSFF